MQSWSVTLSLFICSKRYNHSLQPSFTVSGLCPLCQHVCVSRAQRNSLQDFCEGNKECTWNTKTSQLNSSHISATTAFKSFSVYYLFMYKDANELGSTRQPEWCGNLTNWFIMTFLRHLAPYCHLLSMRWDVYVSVILKNDLLLASCLHWYVCSSQAGSVCRQRGTPSPLTSTIIQMPTVFVQLHPQGGAARWDFIAPWAAQSPSLVHLDPSVISQVFRHLSMHSHPHCFLGYSIL